MVFWQIIILENSPSHLYFTAPYFFKIAGAPHLAHRFLQYKKHRHQKCRCFYGSVTALQNIDDLPGKGFVHAAHGTKFTAHAAGLAVIVLRRAAVANGPGGQRCNA